MKNVFQQKLVNFFTEIYKLFRNKPTHNADRKEYVFNTMKGLLAQTASKKMECQHLCLVVDNTINKENIQMYLPMVFQTMLDEFNAPELKNLRVIFNNIMFES